VSEPIPPLNDALIRPLWVTGGRGVAAAMVCPEGFPYSEKHKREVFEDARRLINESLTRRQVPTPPGGWTLGMLHPEEHWQDHLAPPVVAQVTDALERLPAGAAVAVVLALDASEGAR
jgi:hypothetical protein